MDNSPRQHQIIQILRLTCFLLFLGRGWQHLLGEVPYPSPLIAQVLGGFYLLMALLSWILKREQRFGKILLWLSAASLTVLSFLYFQQKAYEPPQFFEYASQVLSPIFLAIAIYQTEQLKSKSFMRWIQVAVALTFFSHGLYALDVYPRPASFVEMTTRSLGVSEGFAENFLLGAGILDMLVTVGIFLGNYSKVFIAWCIIWGFFTALARTWAYVELGPDLGALLVEYIPHTLYRMPHTLIPLLLWMLQFANKK